MLIKSGKDAFIKQIKPHKKAILLLLVLILTFLAGGLTYRFADNTGLVAILYTPAKIIIGMIPNLVEGKFSTPEKIFVDINYTDFQELTDRRSLALETGTLYGIENDWVDAQIRYKTDTIPARVRLKGGGADAHLRGRKWSMRVEIQGDKNLFGIREFSLMDPLRRSYMLEWLIRQVMRKEGVISKRYDFVQVIINGENRGIYAMDEHFGKTMLEANQRREGPIIRLAQEPIWAEKAAFYLASSERDDYYFSADIDAIGSRKIMSDGVAFEQFEKAVALFEAFRNGDLPTREVFEVDKLAKWMAVSDIMGAWHGFATFNMKFYYNPITSKLEPAPDDTFNEGATDPGERIFRLNDQYNKGAFLKQLFSDLSFTEKYLGELERVSEKSYLDNILDELNEEITRNLNVLYKDYPGYEFPKDQLYRNQESIREILNPYRGIIAYFKEEGTNSVMLSIASVKTIPMEILNVTYGESTVLEPEQERTILSGKDYARPLVYNEIEFNLPDGFDGTESLSELKVNYKLLGTSRLRSESVFPYPSFNQQFLTTDFIRQQPNFNDFSFLRVDSSTNQIHIEKGNWLLSQNLIIPEGYTFISNAGTNLDLTNSAKILSYSPIIFIGSEDYPITISSSDSTGQGIVVLNSSGESFLENVIFKNLSAPSQSGWQLTGAVTFYESPVYISRSRFLENKSEDALNIIRSKFRIEDSLFKNNLSDAFDSDFSKGFISRTSFVNSGNDAMDFSGSVVDVSDCYIDGAGDKGLSVGEISQVTVNQIEIKNSKIAVASKDMSELNIEDINIYNSEIGLAAYQKKPEFGPATISASKAKFMDVSTIHLIEEGSTLVLDGNKIEGTQRDVYKEIYGD